MKLHIDELNDTKLDKSIYFKGIAAKLDKSALAEYKRE